MKRTGQLARKEQQGSGSVNGRQGSSAWDGALSGELSVMNTVKVHGRRRKRKQLAGKLPRHL